MSDSSNEPRLVIAGGSYDGTTLVVNDSSERVIGSGPSCDLKLSLDNVDALHAQVLWSDDGMVFSDLGSAAGTYVNGEKVEADRTLKNGDRICLGPPGSAGTAKLIVHIPEGWGQSGAGSDGLVLESEPMTFDHGESTPSASDRIKAPREETEEAPLADMPPSIAPPGEDVFVFEEPEPTLEPPLAPPPFAPSPTPSAAPEAPPLALKEETPEQAEISIIPPPPKPARAERPDYQTEPPSIGVSRPYTPVRRPAPPLPRRPAPPISRRPSISMPRPVILVGALAVIAALGGSAWFFLRMKAPVLSSLTPPKAEPGQAVTINGQGFATVPNDNVVRIGDKSAEVLSASATQLQCQVPIDVSGNLAVTVAVQGKTSRPLTLAVAIVPVITAVAPDVAMPGDTVTITGVNLVGASTTVLVSDIIAEVREKQPTRISFVVPAMKVTIGDSAMVTVRVGRETSRPATMILGRLPLLSGIDPKRGLPGTRVVLQGRGFSAEPKGNVVAFGDRPALVLSASGTSITALAPAPIVAQVQVDVPITVKSQENVSNPHYFTLLGTSTGVYRPYFFPAPTDHAEHDHVFVSTELGPVLLLTGKAEAASTVERALRVCQLLNQLVDSEPQQTPLFQAQQGRPPRIVSGALSLAVTDADVTGYAERWLSARSAPRPSARSIASYWAALLNDYFALFMQRLRPVAVVQLAPRSRALLEIYAEAHRRGGTDMGVPTALVRPLPSHLSKALNEMAFMIPTGGATQAGTAVVGFWQGTMQESDWTRPLQVTLSGEGSRLTGSMKIQKGSLSLNSPLKDVSFSGGTLQFTVLVGGSPLVFRGALQGALIEGSIHEKSASGKTVGRFSLKFVE